MIWGLISQPTPAHCLSPHATLDWKSLTPVEGLRPRALAVLLHKLSFLPSQRENIPSPKSQIPEVCGENKPKYCWLGHQNYRLTLPPLWSSPAGGGPRGKQSPVFSFGWGPKEMPSPDMACRLNWALKPSTWLGWGPTEGLLVSPKRLNNYMCKNIHKFCQQNNFNGNVRISHFSRSRKDPFHFCLSKAQTHFWLKRCYTNTKGELNLISEKGERFLPDAPVPLSNV